MAPELNSGEHQGLLQECFKLILVLLLTIINGNMLADQISQFDTLIDFWTECQSISIDVLNKMLGPQEIFEGELIIFALPSFCDKM